MDLEKREWEGVDWHPQACDRNQRCALYKHSNETLGSFKLREFYEDWSTYSFPKRDSSPWSLLVM